MLIVALSSLISTKLVRRVHAVQASIEALGEGDLSVPCDVVAGDEIGAMARATERARASVRDVITAVMDAGARVEQSSSSLSQVSDRPHAPPPRSTRPRSRRPRRRPSCPSAPPNCTTSWAVSGSESRTLAPVQRSVNRR